MGEIIDIRSRLGRSAGDEIDREDGGNICRVRLCGPDCRWLGVVGGVLARALVLEGFYTVFEDPEETVSPPSILLRFGRELVTEIGFERCPGLVVAAGSKLPAAALRGSDSTTLALLYGGGEGEGQAASLGFTGTVVPLAVAVAAPEPLEVAAACIGGAARLLGTIGWTSLEQALREELGLFDSAMVHRHLAMALEAFDRAAPWAGRVVTVPEEIFDSNSPA